MANRSRLSTFILIVVAIFELNQSILTLANNDVTGDEKIGRYPSMTVKICNKLPGEFLKTHCMSGGNDFGIHSVAINGCETWNFRPNFWGTTVYLCAIEWLKHGLLRFNPYDFKRDFPARCTSKCLWNVDAGGVHGFTQMGKEDTTIAWPKIKLVDH